METSPASLEKSLAVQAYIETIRSVLFIDDQFPTYDEPDGGRHEAQRARELWAACRKRGWLCDIDNVADWSSVERKRRLGACDLLVLDFHLAGQDPTGAIHLVRQLAANDDPNLVAVYTASNDPAEVLLKLLASVRGVSAEVLNRDEPEIVSEVVDAVTWTHSSLLSRILGKGDWFSLVQSAGESLEVDVGDVPTRFESMIDRYLKDTFGAEAEDQVRNVEAAGINGSCCWFQAGNLFVAVIQKPSIVGERSEFDTLFEGLKSAVVAWNPPALACAIAASRHTGNAGAFRDDIESLHDGDLTVGLLHFIRSASDEAEKARRSRAVAEDLLQRRFEAATDKLASTLCEQTAAIERSQLAEHHIISLNAFLCSQAHDRQHLDLGTIFRGEDSSDYWLCVTPACDMVPRRQVQSDKSPVAAESGMATIAPKAAKTAEKARRLPWRVRLGTNLSLTAIEVAVLEPEDSARKTQLKEAVQGRLIFFTEKGGSGSAVKVGAIIGLERSATPKVEHMLAANLGKVTVDEDGIKRAEICRLHVDGEAKLVMKVEKFVVVAQLRAPYAERISSLVGAHTSRIGVDFVNFE